MTTARGIWLGASRALNRPVPVHQPYPHVCGLPTGCRCPQPHRITRRDCGACGDHWVGRTDVHRHPYRASGLGCCPLPPGHRIHDAPDHTDDLRQYEARRTGDH